MNRTLGMMVAVLAAMAAPAVAACADDETCEWDGETYEPGEVFPAGDGCNSCSCGEDGQVSCTLVACLPDTRP